MQAKPSQERSRAVFKPPKTAEGGDFWGPKAKGIHRAAKTIPQIGGVGGLAEASGGLRGGKLPRSSAFGKVF